MSAHDDLLDLYEQWRTWSETEGEAIKAGAWPQVAQCQDAKLKLQSRILTATEVWQSEDPKRRQEGTVDPQVRRVVGELILLEVRNSEWVSEQRRQANRERDQLHQSRRNLRHIQKAYAASPGARWQSYS
jgi:hypothetical protein